MAAKFLGQFLLENGSITKQQLLAALEAQRASNPLLGELAQARGWMTAEQSRQVNDRQRAEDSRFGDIAESMGLLDAAQIGELLATQKAQRKLFGEILVEQGSLTHAQLEAQLQFHRADREVAIKDLELGIAAHSLGDALTSAINTCSRLFPRTLGSQCLFSRLVDGPADVDWCELTAAVRVESERPLTIAMGCSRITARQMASAFLSIPLSECDDALATDALGELVNVLMGYVVKDTLPEDARYRAAPPDMARAAATLVGEGDESLAVAMTSHTGPFALIVTG